MFSLIVENIRKRYTKDDLSKRYGVNLPSKDKIESILETVDGTSKLDGHRYELVNSNKFKKEKGTRAHVSILNEQNALFFEYRMSWLEKILFLIMSFFLRIKEKIVNFIENLLSKVPNFIKLYVKFLVVLPFNIIMMIVLAIRGALRAPGGIIGIILGIIFVIAIVIPFRLIMELLSLIFLPIINKIADSNIDKPIIRRMVIGSFMDDGKFGDSYLLSEDMVDEITFESHKNLLGKESLYICVKEGFEKVSILDRILTFVLPNYFLNRRTVFITNPEYKNQFENLFQKNK